VRLAKDQRNEIFEAVQAGGLDPRNFKLVERRLSSGVQLTHRPTRSALKLESRSPLPLARLAPVITRSASTGKKPPFRRWALELKIADDPKFYHRVASWGEVTEQAKKWVEGIAREISTPDYWEELRRASRTAQDPNEDNSLFSEGEQHEIVEKLDLLKASARASYGLTDDQMIQLEAKLDYLADATKRVGRLDWKTLVAGTLLTMVSEAVLPPDTTHRIFAHLLSSVSHVLGHPILQLGP
jgi:hypothetical protein